MVDGEPGNEQDFTMWVANAPHGPGHLGSRGAMLKTGPQVVKVVTISDYGDGRTGELSKRELRIRTVPRRAGRSGYDFDNPRVNWACENEELEKVLAFLPARNVTEGSIRRARTPRCSCC
jgi:hypothetical protein